MFMLETPRPRHRRTAIALSTIVALAISVAVAWLSVRLASDRIDIPGYDESVALEGGVRPLVTDRVGELGTVTAVTVKRTPDQPAARAHLVAPVGEERASLSIVSTPWSADDHPVDGVLADGRPYEFVFDNPRYVALATAGVDGQYVEVYGRAMSFEELLGLTVAFEVGRDGIHRLPVGWVELGQGPMPPWDDGIGTYYDFLGGRRLGITVERASSGREVLAAFADVTPVDAIVDGGVGDWAYRYSAPASGILFGMGDVVVELDGDFSDREFLMVAHSLREMRPDEHPILEPDPSPF